MYHFPKRIIGLSLALVMLFLMLPVSALAAKEEQAEQPQGAEAVFATLAETPEASYGAVEPAQLAADGDLTIPGYNKVIHRSQILADRKYLVVAEGENSLYALYPRLSDANAGSLPSSDTYGLRCAKLSVNGSDITALAAASHGAATLGTSVALSDLQMTITASGTGYEFKSSANGNIKLNLDSAMFSDTATALTVEVNDTVIIRNGGNRYLTFSECGTAYSFSNNGTNYGTDFWGPNAKQGAPIYLYIEGELPEVIEPELEFPTPPSGATIRTNAEMIPASGTSEGQPFASGTGGSTNYRIPAIITLRHQSDATKNGRIVAAIDARWNTTVDAGCLDTILSYSDDNGETWNYNFPNYFGDSTNAYHSSATAFIDPQLTEALDGTLYLLVDIWPGGVALNSADNNNPDRATGYVTVDGVKRMALYTSVSGQTDDNYEYYVGDFDANGYATIYKKDKTETDLYVDQYYYLYRQAGDARNADNDKVYCERLGGNNEWVQQNLFFKRATLHVRYTSHLWIVKSTDGGATWSKPILNNDQVRTGEHGFYGVGPGAGLCVETNSETNPNAIPNGTILMPTYFNPGEIASFIYTTDNGATWRRGNNASSSSGDSSESCLVQLNDTTVRHFYRDSWNDSGVFRYTDHTWDPTANDGQGGWITGEVVRTDIPRRGPCQMAALRYSTDEDGAPIILLSAPTNPGARQNGKIYVAKVKADGTMEKLGSYEVNGENENYAYSSITETKNGDIAVLYEVAGNNVPFQIIPYGTIRYGEELGELIRQVEGLKAAAYSEESWNALAEALTTAHAAMASGAKADIENALTPLQTALDNLEILPLVITGTVKNAATNALVSGAVVTLEDEDYRPVGLTATTGTDGVFRFASTDDVPLSVGSYMLKVQAPGYLVSTHAATEITDRTNLTSTTNVTITPESTEGSIYSNNFDENDTSMMGYLSPAGTSGVPTFEHVEYNGSGAIKVTMNSGDRGINNAVVKVDAAKITNGTVSFDITGVTNTSRLGVTLRGVEPLKRIYMGQGNKIRSWFWEYWNGSTSSTYPSESVKPIGIYPGETRRVRVELNDKNIQLFIDGVQVYNENMTAPPTEAGYVGINMQDNSGTSYILDNFRVVSKDAPPANSHFISGRVMDGDTPVANAQVVLRKTDDTRITSITTNANGEFKTSPTTETSVKLSVTASGYVTPAAETISLTSDITNKVISLTADKTALTALYNAHKNDQQGSYSDASWANFQTALTAAGTVEAKTGATKAEIDKAIADLNAAIAALTEDEPPVAVDTAALTAAIAAANAAKEGVQTIDGKTAAEVEDGVKFVTTTEMTALNEAIAAAQAVLNKADKTQSEVDGAVTPLTTATTTFTSAVKTGAKPAVDTSALTAAIKAAEDAKKGVVVATDAAAVPSNKKFVSQDVMDALNAAIDDAKEALEAGDQSTVDGAVAALNAAVDTFNAAKQDGTKKVTPPVVVVPTEPDVTENPDGSKTTTETAPDGTVTETTEKADGTVEATETKPDGTITETVTAPDGAKTEKVTDPEKNVAITVTDAEGETVAEVKLPAVIPAPETRFEDVPEGHWADTAVHNVAALGLVEGVGDSKYDPNAGLTRGDLATVLHRLSNKPAGSEVNFEDVNNEKYYAEGVAWAAKTGVVTGFSKDVFKPEQTITREQLALMLMRYAELLGVDTTVDTSALDAFADNGNIHDWAAEGMAWCVKTGILKGMGSNTLAPTHDVTRAQVAVMLDRFVALMK